MNEGYVYLQVFLWGPLVLLALLGLGRFAGRMLGMGEADWGLQMVWGLAVALWIGGWLLWAEVFSPGAVDALVALGVALLVLDRWRWHTGPPWIDTLTAAVRAHPVAELVPWLVLLVFYAGGIAWIGETDRNDDLVSYFAFPRMLYETGTLYDPFAFRRMTTYGGQPFLQALSTRLGSEMNYHFADCALARVLLFGLVRGALRTLRESHPWRVATILTAVLLLPIPRNNTTSELIHAVWLLAVPLTWLAARGQRLQDVFEPQRTNSTPPRALVLCGLVIFAASTFRPHIGFAAATLFSVGVLATSNTARSTRAPWLAIGVTGAMVLALLIPWAAMLHASSGSIAFPPFRGHLSSEFAQMHALTSSPGAALRSGGKLLARVEVVALMLPLLAFAVRSPPWTRWLAISTLAICLLTAAASSALSFPYFYRYVWPIPFALVLFLFLALTLTSTRKARHVLLLASFALVGVVLLPRGVPYLVSIARDIPRQVEARPSPLRVRNQAQYQHIQQAIPAGASVLAMTDLPYLFDHGRNAIHTIDAPGAVSPGGRMPFFAGPEALRNYLLDQGIAFIAYTRPARAILQYRRDYWEDNPRPEPFYREVWAPPMLDLMDNLDLLSTPQRMRAETAKLVLVDLRDAPASVPPDAPSASR